jgi:hypothetical protein
MNSVFGRGWRVTRAIDGSVDQPDERIGIFHVQSRDGVVQQAGRPTPLELPLERNRHHEGPSIMA